MAPNVDYSIYLVTDSTMVPDSVDFLHQVKSAVENGATVVQLREKLLSTRDFVKRAEQVLRITRQHGVPLIINDRVDVALAIDADGVHVGQDDMPAEVVRRLIGPDKILGVSCSTWEHTQEVCAQGVADYVGLGSLFPTNTKQVKTVCGPIGVRQLLRVLQKHNSSKPPIKCVAIGGINHSNVALVMHLCRVLGPDGTHGLDGVAVVSCIMAAADAASATSSLAQAYRETPPYVQEPLECQQASTEKALVHHITNNVVKNFSANVTLAVGGSPIMSELPEEYEEFACLPGPASLVVNLGTPSALLMEVFLHGLRTYNKHGKPVVFDPVAAGASRARLAACRALLNAGYFTVIKGNLGEILALDSLAHGEGRAAEPTMQGVDSVARHSAKEAMLVACRVALEYALVVVVSGETNYIADGRAPAPRTWEVAGGHKLMGLITGTGCSLGSVIGTFVARAKALGGDVALATVDAVRYYNEAGAAAGKISEGPGSFAKNFLDELFRVNNIR